MAEAPTQPISQLRPGDVIGGYQVLSELGQGGMAVVYRVRHVQTLHEAALKTPLAGLEQVLIDRFLSEGKAHFQLVSQPHIVGPLSYGTLPDGRPYLVMQLIKGVTLEKWVGQELQRTGKNRLQLGTALRFGIQLANGLNAAHSLRPPVIHRDLKPANVFVEPDRLVNIASKDVPTLSIGDFGLAWSRGDELLHSGTPEYVSPEQSLFLEPTTASDLYTLGVILFELLEGQLPITGADTLALLEAHRQAAPRRLDPVGRPSALIELVAQLLEKQPGNRPGSALQVANRLTAILDELEGRREPTQVNFNLAAYEASRPTDQLPAVAAATKRNEAEQSITRRPKLAIGLVVLAAIVAFFIARALPPPQPIAEPGPAPREVIPTEPVLPPAVLAPVVIEPIDAGAPDELSPLNPKPKVTPGIDCVADERWRRIMEKDLNEVRDLVATRDVKQFAAFEAAQARIAEKISRATTPQQCAAVQAEVDRVVQKYNPR